MRSRARVKVGATLDTVRALALALPGVDEGTSYGTPAFKVGGKLFARLHQDGESLVVRVDPDARDMLLRSEPETFYITDHYVGYPFVLVRLARAAHAPLAALLEEAWRSVAPRRLLAAGAPGAAPDGPVSGGATRGKVARKKPREPGDGR